MFCCNSLPEAADRGASYLGPKACIDDRRIVNEIDTDYFIRVASGHGYEYCGINNCLFCRRVLWRGLWTAEKQK